MPESRSELEAAVAAERQRQQAAQTEDQRACEAAVRESENAGARIYDALTDALNAGSAAPVHTTVTTRRAIPATTRTVERPWPFPPKVVIEPEHEIEEESLVVSGRTTAVTVETRDAAPAYRWREPYPQEHWIRPYKFNYSMTVENEGDRTFAAALEHYRVIHSWSDAVGGEHHEREWLTESSFTFGRREEWLEACRSESDPVLNPDALLADAIVAELARRLA
jgi:hypothetical protein